MFEIACLLHKEGSSFRREWEQISGNYQKILWVF